MTLDYYELEVNEQLMTYEFVSRGPKGDIPKLVQFSLIDQEESVYNLALGDRNKESGEMNDNVTTDNKDTEKVFATVAAIVYHFYNRLPNVWVYATGNTDSRTRLYRMGLNKYFDTVSEGFQIYGRRDGNWEVYKKDTNYQAFAVQKKHFKFEI